MYSNLADDLRGMLWWYHTVTLVVLQLLIILLKTLQRFTDFHKYGSALAPHSSPPSCQMPPPPKKARSKSKCSRQYCIPIKLLGPLVWLPFGPALPAPGCPDPNNPHVPHQLSPLPLLVYLNPLFPPSSARVSFLKTCGADYCYKPVK